MREPIRVGMTENKLYSWFQITYVLHTLHFYAATEK